MPPKRNWRPFEEARSYVRSLGLKGTADWLQWRKSGERPPDIPTNPNTIYKDEWTSMGDWLGTGRSPQGEWRSFEEAREHARSLGLNSVREWEEYCKSGDRPGDLPALAHRAYKGQGWTGWGDFLGTGNVRYREWRPYEEAREYARGLGLRSYKEWQAFMASPRRPADIPVVPSVVYKDDGWSGWADWLDTENYRVTWRPFEEAREFARGLGLGGQNEWFAYCRGGEKPEDIPYDPRSAYQEQGWVSMGDWLGTGNIYSGYRQWRPFEEARAYIRSLGIRTVAEWHEYCKSGQKPDDIPPHP